MNSGNVPASAHAEAILDFCVADDRVGERDVRSRSGRKSSGKGCGPDRGNCAATIYCSTVHAYFGSRAEFDSLCFGHDAAYRARNVFVETREHYF